VSFDRIIQLTQLGSIVCGIVYFGVEAGRRDERLETTSVKVNELAQIVQDLTKSQIAGAANQANAGKELDNLRARVERLESR
jgi:hypothetical protein